MKSFNKGDLVIYKGHTKAVIWNVNYTMDKHIYYVIFVKEGVREGTFTQAHLNDLELDISQIRDNKLGELGI
jgi:hypothetical protein